MTMDTSRALTSAAKAAKVAAERTAIERLSSAPIAEVQIKPVLDMLIQRWQDEGSLTKPPPPILGPILLLESVRLAEAVNRLEGVPGAERELADLPPLSQENLDAGGLLINKAQLQKLRTAVERLKAKHGEVQVAQGLLQDLPTAVERLEARRQEIQIAGDLLEGLATDCAGPLGAVYGTGG